MIFLRAIIPFGFSFVAYGIWRLVRNVEKPVVTILNDVHQTLQTTQVLLVDLQKTIETTRKTVQDIDEAVIDADQIIDDVRSPVTQAIMAAEDTIHDIDNTIHVMQLRPIVSGIKMTGTKIKNCLLCRCHAPHEQVHEHADGGTR